MKDRASDPGTLSILQRRITEAARKRDQPARRVQISVAQVVVAQMIPFGAIKGGTAMKLRLGGSFTRDSTDLDTAARLGAEQFGDALAAALDRGWNRFTGRAARLDAPRPPGVPASYVMQPFDVRLAYRGKPFSTLRLEVGYDELDVLGDGVDEHLAPDLADLFAELGLAAPDPVALLPAPVQIAQKLHACTAPGSQRAHDLVDLQLLVPTTDAAAVARACHRLFSFRRSHAFPPVVVAGPGWGTLYAEAAVGLDVHADVEQAVTWANDYVQQLSGSDVSDAPSPT